MKEIATIKVLQHPDLGGVGISAHLVMPTGSYPMAKGSAYTPLPTQFSQDEYSEIVVRVTTAALHEMMRNMGETARKA